MNRMMMIAFGMAAGFALSVYVGGSRQVRLPWATESIRVESKGTYDGFRIQNGETDMEMQVAALRIENLTEEPLDGTVTVQSGEKKLMFPFEALPPGQVTMVMAENGEHWFGSLQWIQAETEKSNLLPEGTVDIQETGDITLLLVNRTDRGDAAVQSLRCSQQHLHRWDLLHLGCGDPGAWSGCGGHALSLCVRVQPHCGPAGRSVKLLRAFRTLFFYAIPYFDGKTPGNCLY